jgi:hypothetical protein
VPSTGASSSPYGAPGSGSSSSASYDAGQPSPYGATPQTPYGSPYGRPATPGTDGFAIASLVTGILSLGVVALVLGIVGLNRVKRSGQGGKGLAIAGIVLGVLGTLGWIVGIALSVWVFSNMDELEELGRTSSSSVVQDDAAGSAEDAGLAGLTGSAAADAAFDLGGCFDSPASGNVLDIEFVDCAQAHEFEVYGVDAFADGAYPGDETIRDLAVDFCETAFEDYVSVDYYDSTLDYDAYVPDDASWEQGDRELACYAYSLDGEQLTDSVRGSGL